MEELHPHGAEHRPPMQEKQVASAAGVLDGVFNEVHDCVALEFGAAAKAEVSCKHLTVNVYRKIIQCGVYLGHARFERAEHSRSAGRRGRKCNADRCCPGQ